MIRKVGTKHEVVSKKSGKRLSNPTSRRQAIKRLRQIEFFKRRGM